MTVYSGKGGTCSDGGDQITSWSLSITSNNSSWGSTSTNGYKDRVVGVKEGSGSIEGKWNGSAPFTVGESTTLTLGTGSGTFGVPCLIDGLSLDVNIDDGEVVGWSAEFSSNGAIT